MEDHKETGFLRETKLSRGKAIGAIAIFLGGGQYVIPILFTLIAMLALAASGDLNFADEYALLDSPLMTTLSSWGMFLGFGIVALIFLLMFRRQLVHDWKRIESAKKFWGTVIVYWLCVLGLLIITNLIIFAILGEEATAGNQEMLEYMAGSYPVLIGISAVLFAPFVEEIAFRMAIMKLFEKWPWIAITFSSLIFGLLHVVMTGDFIFLLSYAAMGFPMAYSYYKTGNIWYPVAIHFIQNLFAVMQMFML